MATTSARYEAHQFRKVIREILSLVVLMQVMPRLRATLNPAAPEQGQVEMSRAMPIGDRKAISPQPQSVTEGTTKLIGELKARYLSSHPGTPTPCNSAFVALGASLRPTHLPC